MTSQPIRNRKTSSATKTSSAATVRGNFRETSYIVGAFKISVSTKAKKKKKTILMIS